MHPLTREGRTTMNSWPQFWQLTSWHKKSLPTTKSSCMNARGTPCSDYSFCCPNWVPPRQGTPTAGYPPAGYPHGRVPPQGTPQLGTPGRVPPGWVPPWQVTPGWTWQGTPRPGRVPPCLDLVGYPPGVCPMAFWEMLQSIMGYGYPPMDRQKDRHVSKHYLPVVLRTRAVKIDC